MLKNASSWLLPVALGLAAGATPGRAQTPSSPADVRTPRPDPLDARASVPALVYRSSLLPGRPADAASAASWREANDAVARIGGWRVYAREAQQPSGVATPPPGQPAVAVPNPLPQPLPQRPEGHKTP